MSDISGGATPTRGDSELYADSGIKFLRIMNVQPFKIVLDDVKYIQPQVHNGELARSALKANDVLMTITGRVGTAAVVPNEILPANINQHIVRLRIRQDACLPEYLASWLNTSIGNTMTNREVTGGTRIALDYDAIQKLQFPLPPIEIQRQLVDEWSNTRESRRQKLKQAEELLSGIDSYLLETLGLTPPPAETRKVFAVRLGQIQGRRIDAPAYQPLFAAGHALNVPLSSLSKLAFIDTHVVDKPKSETSPVPYIGLPECSQTEIQDVAMRPYSEVKGRSVVKQGDILFARIEPSIFNKKYVLAEDLKGHEYAYTSTEFYVVTPNPNMVDPYYLYAMFFCAFVFNQVQGKTTGSSGRRRLSPDSFRDLQIPIPPLKLQRAIAAEIKRRREEARRLRAEAEAEWTAAKERFEKSLLGD